MVMCVHSVSSCKLYDIARCSRLLTTARGDTDPSTGPRSSDKLLPRVYWHDVKRDAGVVVLRSKRFTDSTHHLRHVTAAVSVKVWRFLHTIHSLDTPRRLHNAEKSKLSIINVRHSVHAPTENYCYSAEWRELRVSEANRRQKGKRKDLLNKTATKEERRGEEKEEE